MNVKLTLRLDRRLIERAKIYARRTGRSVSQIVAEYFSHLDDMADNDQTELTPAVRKLKGALNGRRVDRSTYRQHLDEKYR